MGFLALSTLMTLSDFKPPKEGVLVNFFAILGCSTHFNTEL